MKRIALATATVAALVAAACGNSGDRAPAMGQEMEAQPENSPPRFHR